MAKPDDVSSALARDLGYVQGEMDDPGLYKKLAAKLTEMRCPDGVLFYLAMPPTVYATIVEQLSAAGLIDARDAGRLAPGHRRETVRHRSRQRARAEPADARASRRVADLPHRSLPREGDRPEPAGVPLRERHVRAGLEPPLHRSRADHRRGDGRRRAARELLRGGRRAARHGPESPDAGARDDRDGAADRVFRRERARPQARRAGVDPADRRRGRKAQTSCARSTRPDG